MSARAGRGYGARVQPEVVVVGSYNQDLAWRCAEFPRPGETTVGRFTTGPGGKGSNQAVAAARAGARTRLVGAVGGDVFGRTAQKFLRAEGIDLHLVRKDAPTGNAAILVDARGQNQIVVALGANLALAPRDVPATLLRGARVVVCQNETHLPTVGHTLRTARRLGALAVLNPAPMPPDFDRAVLAHVDVLIPNESEFAALLGLSSRAAARLATLPAAELHRRCRTLRVPTVIVTLGRRGCLVSQPAGFTAIPAHRVEAIDTTGAGDAFVGAFAAGVVKFDADCIAAARFANAAAALSVTRLGTAPSMPTHREIARLLRVPHR